MIAQKCNTLMGDKVKQLRVQELSKIWDANFLQSSDGGGGGGDDGAAGRSRCVVREGMLTKTNSRNASRPVTVILFSDQIAYGDRDWLTGRARLRGVIPLRLCTLL